ncbi:DNA-binding protein [Bacillus thuringiensis]|uniref:DNA-binding protein n=1 Tax=Bacillus thuringiensis TaxID=1428 RepID=A0A9X7AYV4_BACTU|nr:DNA-binding protein [Bacillus thuringiensis]
MNKTELIKQVAQEANLTQKDATASVQAVLDQITQALAKGDSVQLIGFGTFEVRERSARTGRNPQTARIEVLSLLAS